MTCGQCGAKNCGFALSCCNCGYVIEAAKGIGQDAAKTDNVGKKSIPPKPTKPSDQAKNLKSSKANIDDAAIAAKKHLPPQRRVHCTKCGKPNSPDMLFCQFCGKPRQAAFRAKLAPLQHRNIRLLSGIAAAVAVVAVGAMLLYCRFSPPPTAFYYKSNAVSAANLSTLNTYQVSDNAESVDESDVLSAYIFTSPDDRYLYYPEDRALYRRDLLADPKDKDAVTRIGTDLGYFFEITPDNKAVYLTQSNGDLYIHDGKNRKNIASDVSDCTLSEDGTQLIYANQDGDIYLGDIQTSSNEKMVSNAQLLFVSEDFTAVCYEKNGDLYEQIMGQKKQKIASNVSSFIARMNDGTLYYTKSQTDTLTLSSCLNDDLRETDAVMSEPNIADYQTQAPYTDWWGNTAYETVTDYDAYDTAYNAYNEKLMRDELRAQAKRTMDFSHVTLYAYKDGEETTVTDNFAHTLITSDNGLLVYKKTAYTTPQKINISEANDIRAITALLDDYQSEDSAVYAVLDGTETLLAKANASTFAVSDSFFYSEDERTLYFLDEFDTAAACGTLKSITVGNEAFSPPQIVDEEVSTCTFDPNTNTLLYFKKLKDGFGDLYMNGNKIDSDVSLYGMLLSQDGKTLYYMTDMHTEGLGATLMRWNNAGKQRVADDVAQAVLIGDKLVYLSGFSALSHTGDLYLYTGRDSKLIDDDVSYLFDAERYAEKPAIYFMDYEWQQTSN